MSSVLTVASTSDWKVRTGGSLAMNPAFSAARICFWRARVRSNVCSAAFVGKELNF
jgi:hypothetical protein